MRNEENVMFSNRALAKLFDNPPHSEDGKPRILTKENLENTKMRQWNSQEKNGSHYGKHESSVWQFLLASEQAGTFEMKKHSDYE